MYISHSKVGEVLGSIFPSLPLYLVSSDGAYILRSIFIAVLVMLRTVQLFDGLSIVE
jgi:hypothetical protein